MGYTNVAWSFRDTVYYLLYFLWGGNKVNKEIKFIKCLIVFFCICVAVVVVAYVLNFSGANISNDPSDWGVLGDYFGGVLNPLISLFTLFFLIKTYLSQKKELHQSEMEAKEQRKIAQKTVEMQMLTTKISASYELISVYKAEMEGVTLAINADSHYGRDYTAINGEVYSPDRAKKYRAELAKKISAELESIKGYLEKCES